MLKDVGKPIPVDKQWSDIQKVAPSEDIVKVTYRSWLREDGVRDEDLDVDYRVGDERVTAYGRLGEVSSSPSKYERPWFPGNSAEQIRMDEFIAAVQAEENQCGDFEDMSAWVHVREEGHSIFEIRCQDRDIPERPKTTKLLTLNGERIDVDQAGRKQGMTAVLALAAPFADEVTSVRWFMEGASHSAQIQIQGPEGLRPTSGLDLRASRAGCGSSD